MKKLPLVLVAVTVALGAFGGIMYLRNSTPVTPAISAAEIANPTKPFVVKLHARWCPVCMTTTSIWTQVEEAYGTRINLVVFDFTNEATTSASEAEARRLGLDQYFADAGGTGSIAVLHARTREVLSEIQGSRDFSEYRTAIDAALAGMRQ